MKVSELFYVDYGTSLELNRCCVKKNGINFVSRTAKNNGISTTVETIPNVKPLEAGLITVAANGSTMASFVQNKPFYTGYHIFCLRPKGTMTIQEKIFYCMCLRKNKYRFSYGRQANQTLKDLELPDNIPSWVNTISTEEFVSKESHSKEHVNLDDKKWKIFEMNELFIMKRGTISGLDNKITSGTRVISATTENNGLSCFCDKYSESSGNVFTIANTGQGSVGVVFYQNKPFVASNNVPY